MSSAGRGSFDPAARAAGFVVEAAAGSTDRRARVRVRALRVSPNHAWRDDFVHARTHDGRPLKLMTMVDEHTRECLCIDVARRLRSEEVLYRLGRLMVQRGVPEYVRSDNGPEFIATALREWLDRVGAKTLCIDPDSPWESGYGESFNVNLRDELLSGKIFYTLCEARAVIETWRREDNEIRPHSSLGDRSSAPEALLPARAGSASLRLPLRVPAGPPVAATRSPRFQSGD
ncbi:MAG: integrase core domain-containing protein [Planctomycetota bacterium]